MERLEQWLAANKVEDDQKVAVFLSVIGAKAYAVLKHLLLPDIPSTKMYSV